MPAFGILVAKPRSHLVPGAIDESAFISRVPALSTVGVVSVAFVVTVCCHMTSSPSCQRLERLATMAVEIPKITTAIHNAPPATPSS
jgi:hypothetical protein